MTTRLIAILAIHLIYILVSFIVITHVEERFVVAMYGLSTFSIGMVLGAILWEFE